MACRGEPTLKKYLPYRGWESFYSCWGISICVLWTWINSCWFRIHEERLQHISASQQGLSLALLLALFCLCFTCLTNESANSCRCNRSLSVWFHSQKKFRRIDIFTHSWSGVWRGNCSVLRRNGFFFFFLEEEDIEEDKLYCLLTVFLNRHLTWGSVAL